MDFGEFEPVLAEGLNVASDISSEQTNKNKPAEKIDEKLVRHGEKEISKIVDERAGLNTSKSLETVTSTGNVAKPPLGVMEVVHTGEVTKKMIENPEDGKQVNNQ